MGKKFYENTYLHTHKNNTTLENHSYSGMLMVQQQQPQQPQEQHYSASSPFIPITDSPASTLDLKSPSLNENNFPLNIPPGPDINEQNLDRKEELPKNNISNKPSN